MTRFWISPDMAVDYILNALKLKSGCIYVPIMKSLEIETVADFIVGEEYPRELIPVRYGEKQHETILTVEETARCYMLKEPKCIVVYPSVNSLINNNMSGAYTSFTAPRFTKDEFLTMLGE